MSSQFQTFAHLSYMQLQGRTTRIGDVIVCGQPLPSEVRGKFDDVHTWALDLGGRYFFANSTPVRPYFAGYVGADRADEARVQIRVDGIPVTSRPERLLPRETRFNAGVEVGMSYDFSEQSARRFSVGADSRLAARRVRRLSASRTVACSRDRSGMDPADRAGVTFKF